MPERRCATEGCAGTLPVGAGTHCPRCGGTAFVPEPRKRWRGLLFFSLVFAIIAAGALLRTRRNVMSSPDRRDLVQAYEVASQMTQPTARDEAYTEVVHRALAKHDYEYACEVGGSMTMATAKDACLREIVDDALKARQPAWASHAAEEMVMPMSRDAALKRILDAGRQ